MRGRYTPISHGNLSFFVFIFRALRPCDQDSPISVWKPVYLFRAFFYTYGGRWAIEGDSTPCSFVYSKGKHTFLEGKALKNTWPFMRLIEVKERPRVFEEQTRIQSSESDAREEEVLALKHDVSFNRLPIDYCILLYYNCKLKWACFLVFIFYFYSSLIYVYLACESIRFFRSNERKYRIYSINRPGCLLNFWTLRVGA